MPSATDQVQALIEKRSQQLRESREVRKMEDLFSSLSWNVDSRVLKLSDSRVSGNKSVKSTPLVPYADPDLGCMKNLRESWEYLQTLADCNQIHLQNAAAYHQFWHEVEESNDCLQYMLSQVPKRFSPSLLSGRPSSQIKHSLEQMVLVLREYLQWQTRLDILYERSKLIVPLTYRVNKLSEPLHVQLLAEYQTNQFELMEGDMVTLIDNSNQNTWLVEISKGCLLRGNTETQVEVPSILLLVPPTDPAAIQAAVRLRLQMLSIWTATCKRLGPHVTKVLLNVFHEWDETQASTSKPISAEQQASLLSTINFMDQTLGLSESGIPDYKTLREKTTQLAKHATQYEDKDSDSNKSTIVVQLAYINKLLRRYWDFLTYSDSYREVLNWITTTKNVYVHNKRDRMKYITTAFHVKSLECDVEERNLMALEEIDQIDAAHATLTEEEGFYESSSTEQKTETEQLMEAEMEVETTFVITGVVKNPHETPEVIISLQEAIDSGIIHPDSGIYIDRRRKCTIPIPQAMNEGLIKMGPKKEKKSEEKVKSAGIVTVRTTRETRPYSVTQALDTTTGLMLPVQLAYTRGILDPDLGTYKDLDKGSVMLVGDAVQHRLVEVQYDSEITAPMLEEVSQTYLVDGVLCSESNVTLPFHEAVQQGIIDRETGSYKDLVTGESVFVVDAINRGLIKATISDKPPSLQVSQLSQMAVNQSTSGGKRRIINALKSLKPTNNNEEKIPTNYRNGRSRTSRKYY